jgi:hypothetical protein
MPMDGLLDSNLAIATRVLGPSNNYKFLPLGSGA